MSKVLKKTALKKRAFVGKDCVACGTCVKICPLGAISVYKGLYAVADERCVGCGKCAKACPAGVIEVVAKEVVTKEVAAKEVATKEVAAKEVATV